MERSQIHEYPFETKREGVGFLIFEHWNGLAPWKKSNQNIFMLRNFTKKIEADGYTGTECRKKCVPLYHKSELAEHFIS